jgi:hypothetical protein
MYGQFQRVLGIWYDASTHSIRAPIRVISLAFFPVAAALEGVKFDVGIGVGQAQESQAVDKF